MAVSDESVAVSVVAVSVVAVSVVAVTVSVLNGSKVAPLGLRAHQRSLRDWSPRRLPP
jgi:hypothetical protein